MAKVTTTDPAEAERKLAVLRPQLEELEQEFRYGNSYSKGVFLWQ